MKTNLINQTGESIGQVELPPKMFEVSKVKPAVVQLVVIANLANARHPIAATKTRGLVRGGGKKPWKQKGTGRARVGSIRSPLWRGGGIIFGPTPQRNFSKKVNRRTRRLAMFAVLSDRAAAEQIAVLENLDLAEGRTKELLAKLKAIPSLAAARRIVLVLPAKQEKLQRAAGNLQSLRVCLANNLNILDLLWAEKIVILKAALPILKQTYLKAEAE